MRISKWALLAGAGGILLVSTCALDIGYTLLDAVASYLPTLLDNALGLSADTTTGG